MKYRQLGNTDLDDHRHFNRDGEAFNVGETFSGLEFKAGVELSNKLSWIVENRGNMTQATLHKNIRGAY